MKPKIILIFLNLPRFLLGFTFLISAVGKAIDYTDSVKLVELISTKWNILENLSLEIVFLTIVIELSLAVLLLTKKQLLFAYLFSFLFVGFFTSVLGYLFFMDISISSCGCFGAFGFSGGLEVTLIRNVVLLCLIVTGYWIQIQNESIISK